MSNEDKRTDEIVEEIMPVSYTHLKEKTGRGELTSRCQHCKALCGTRHAVS